jgi:hypothetical protein
MWVSQKNVIRFYISLLSVTTQQLSESHSRHLCKMSLLVVVRSRWVGQEILRPLQNPMTERHEVCFLIS